MSTKKYSPIGPAIWPAIDNIYIYEANVLLKAIKLQTWHKVKRPHCFVRFWDLVPSLVLKYKKNKFNGSIFYSRSIKGVMIKNVFQSYIQFNFVHRDNRYKFLEVSHTHVLSSHMVTMDVCSYPPPLHKFYCWVCLHILNSICTQWTLFCLAEWVHPVILYRLRVNK